MSTRKDQTSESRVAVGAAFRKGNRRHRYSSTAEIRAFLCDLKMRPHSQRQVLCRLLHRAAAHASTKDSVVNPAMTHHTTAP